LFIIFKVDNPIRVEAAPSSRLRYICFLNQGCFNPKVLSQCPRRRLTILAKPNSSKRESAQKIIFILLLLVLNKNEKGQETFTSHPFSFVT